MTDVEDLPALGLRVLAEVANLVGVGSGQPSLLRDILMVLETRLGLARGTVLRLTEDCEAVAVEAASSSTGHEQYEASYPLGEGIVGEVVRTGEAAVIPDISGEARFQDRIYRRSVQGVAGVGFICVPIRLGRDVVGALSADVPAPARAEDLAGMLQVAATMLAHDLQGRRVAKLSRLSLQQEADRLRSPQSEAPRRKMVGNSSGINEVMARVSRVAPSDASVLIRGESGTGKELVAAEIHFQSRRAGKPFIKVNCAALSETLLESELFGHEKGAFTGASYRRIGRLEEANGGTLFLDEIGEFSPSVQIKLLRVLQEREFERVGSSETHSTDVRIVCATNRDLEAAMGSGAFREDLFYRINVFPIFIPPLRHRKADILLLANHFVGIYGQRQQPPVKRISTPAINMLLAYHWPGNVRELENCIEHGCLLTDDGVIHGQSLPATLQMPGESEIPRGGQLKARIEVIERDMISDAMKRSNGTVAAAARELGITARMVRYKLQRLGLEYLAHTRKKRR